ncbi:MAG TPA: thiamine phosphate synthase [Terrimicrobiaceae bacterium]|nr:thiamine phosphate synthase [Terrimicrobiaceae bacterium]
MIPSARAALREAQLYGILDLGYVRSDQAFDLAAKSLAGGVQVLQLRAKDQPREETLFLARGLAQLCRQWRVPFILNDHPELVLESEADGAHVGQDDTSVAEARTLAGKHALIGKSTHSLAQALAAQEEKPDYIGFGPLFATPTKPDYAPIGLHDIRAVHQLVTLPIFCIGGIKRENLPDVIAAGTRRVVIVSGILQATDPQAYCEDCRHILAQAGVLER